MSDKCACIQNETPSCSAGRSCWHFGGKTPCGDCGDPRKAAPAPAAHPTLARKHLARLRAEIRLCGCPKPDAEFGALWCSDCGDREQLADVLVGFGVPEDVARQDKLLGLWRVAPAAHAEGLIGRVVQAVIEHMNGHESGHVGVVGGCPHPECRWLQSASVQHAAQQAAIRELQRWDYTIELRAGSLPDWNPTPDGEYVKWSELARLTEPGE